MLKKIYLPIALLCSSSVYAQKENGTQSQNQAQISPARITDSATSKTDLSVSNMQPVQKTVATFTGGLVLAPSLHYFGRTDGPKSAALLPTLTIDFDSIHLYASGTGVIIDNKTIEPDYAGTIAELGYRFGKFDKFSGNVYVNKFFYRTATGLPQSALDEQAGVNLSQRTKYIGFTATGSAAFSDAKTDFFASGGLNRIFRKKFAKSLLIITPTYVVNFGSQNFTAVNAKNSPPLNLLPDEALEDQRRFKILDHEFSVPVIYALKHWYFLVTPSYIRPQNLVNIPGYPQLSETGKNLFYVNLGVLYTFKAKGKARA